MYNGVAVLILLLKVLNRDKSRSIDKLIKVINRVINV